MSDKVAKMNFEQPDCRLSNIRFFFTVCCCLILWMCLMSILSATIEQSYYNNEYQGRYSRKNKCKCKRCNPYMEMELFENQARSQEKSVAAPVDKNYVSNIIQLRQKTEFKSIALTTPENMDSQMITGKADRYITEQNGSLSYLLDIHAYLNVLDGNIYGSESKVEQSYKVYLENNIGNKVSLGKLERHPDNVYKLKFKTDDLSQLRDKHTVLIVHQIGNTEKVILKGQF